jgi:hypothetical protein
VLINVAPHVAKRGKRGGWKTLSARGREREFQSLLSPKAIELIETELDKGPRRRA